VIPVRAAIALSLALAASAQAYVYWGDPKSVEADDHFGDRVFGVGAVQTATEMAKHIGRRAGAVPRRKR
jgi:hypothetical protein